MKQAHGPRLLLIAPAPVVLAGDAVTLDKKFVEGMRLHRDLWNGPVDCLLWQGLGDMPFGATYERAELDFGLVILAAGEAIRAEHLAGYDIIASSADAHETLDIGGMVAAGTRLVLNIEYTLRTRLEIAWLDRSRSLARKAYSMLWTLRQEARRRRAIRSADGLQVNGYPAAKAYGPLSARPMMYLDNRLRPDMYATAAEMAAKAASLRSAAPLRLVHSGRLEPMKGSGDILPICRALRQCNVPFRLDVYGYGSLRGEIEAAIAAEGLSEIVLHDPVDFETVLVPLTRKSADIFLSCHRQSDPSCTYIESLGCGAPIMGYDNQMWSALQQESRGGWVAPMARTSAVAEQLAALHRDREAIIARAENGLAFARQRDFVTEFGKRMTHLGAVLAAG